MPRAKKVSISIRMPAELHEQVHTIAGEMSLDSDSQLYRWIIEGFIDAVNSPEQEPPMSPALKIAKYVHKAKASNR